MSNIKVKILGAELEADLLNPEVARKFEDGYHKAIDRIKNANDISNGPDGLKEQCNAVIGYIDDIFGVGSAKKVFGDSTNLLICLSALEELTSLYTDQVNPHIRESVSRIMKKMDRNKADVREEVDENEDA